MSAMHFTMLCAAIVAACFTHELPRSRRNFGRATERAYLMIGAALITWVNQ